MGEAKRKRELLAGRSCICGSGKVSKNCCFNGKTFWRHPAKVALDYPADVVANDYCYLSSMMNCSHKGSREHLVSRAVLKALKKTSLIVSGLPWQKPGTTMGIGFETLTTKCLCAAHNSALSPLDEAAAQFFLALEAATSTISPPSFKGLVSGHDIERWMLKTLIAMSQSNSLSKDREVLSAPLHSEINVPALLSDPSAWPPGSGLYFTQSLGQQVQKDNQFGLAPLTLESSGELAGMMGHILGLRCTFIALPFTLFSRIPPPGHYRPGKLSFGVPGFYNRISICWEDRYEHGEIVFTPTSSRWPQGHGHH